MDEGVKQLREKEAINWKKELLLWIIMLIAALLAAKMLNSFVIIKAHVDSGSMSPTVNKDDYLLCNKLTYRFKEPERNDIILFAFPDNENKTYVKRIIGLPGETVVVRSGKVYVNDADVPLSETFIKEEMLGDFGPFTVPDGCYFVLGDNRNNSYDSRGWDNPYVSRDEIYGRVWLRYKPDFGTVR